MDYKVKRWLVIGRSIDHASQTVIDSRLEVASQSAYHQTTIIYRHNGLQARPNGLQKQQQSSARSC
jgi:hypothetical protein